MKLGILGAGQLARMLALAAYPLNIKCNFLDPTADSCAAPLGTHIIKEFDDESGLAQLAAENDFVSFEFENVPATPLQSLANQVEVYPPVKALLISQDRLTEKNTLHELGIETAPFSAVNSLDELHQAVDEVGYPGILKTRRFGYDGKGQAVIREKSQLAEAWKSIGEVPATYEGFVNFSREVSIIAVRNKGGETRCYPLVENVHRNGILYLSTVLENDPLQQQAESMINKLINELDYVGVLVLELFHAGDKLVANEYAPRVHNTGHWTIEGAACSQFENHIRAVCGLPLGDTQVNCPVAMINIVGDLPDTNEILKIPGAHLHLYDKTPRAGRKIGHVTVCATNNNELQSRIKEIGKFINW